MGAALVRLDDTACLAERVGLASASRKDVRRPALRRLRNGLPRRRATA